MVFKNSNVFVILEMFIILQYYTCIKNIIAGRIIFNYKMTVKLLIFITITREVMF